jgi:hypothetical protein
MVSGCKFLFYTHTLFEQCTYLGYLFLQAPREYVQHGPLLSINWLRLCPQSGTRVRSHAVWRRLFIVLMTAAHISANVFSLQNSLSNIHVLFLTIHSTSFISIIHHIHTSNCIFYLHDIFILWLLQIFMAGWMPSVPCVRYNYYILVWGLSVKMIYRLFPDTSCYLCIWQLSWIRQVAFFTNIIYYSLPETRILTQSVKGSFRHVSVLPMLPDTFGVFKTLENVCLILNCRQRQCHESLFTPKIGK